MRKDLVKSNLANIVSGIALFFTWLALFFLLKDKFYFSYGLILVAFNFDAIDGYLARKFAIDNQLGRVLDGYVDIINYLIYPAIAFVTFFKLDNVFSLISIFIFLAAGIFRLARFGVRGIKKDEGEMYYEGLPVFISPILILVFLFVNQVLDRIFFTWFSIMVLLIVSSLMIQTFKFPKPKNIVPILLTVSILSFAFLFKDLW